MDIRGFLLILNAIIVISTLVIYTIIGENLNIVGETNEEQARNEKGFTGWFLVSVVIGVLALPIMVAREIWHSKRDKLPRFEWDTVGRYGFAIILGSCLNTCLLVFTSCSAAKPITTERIVYKIDTLYKMNVRADTLHILDSVFVNQYVKGDTVYKEKTAYKWRDKVSVRVDTLYKNALRTDSVRVPTPVERKLTAWEKTSMYVGKFAIGVVVMVVVSLLLWLIHRKK